MIQYPISRADLEARIEQAVPGWLARAAQRTAGFKDQGKYAESSTIWSEVKPVYMDLQGCKCVYCESKQEAVEFGKVAQDVEHFRPKGRVSAWKAPARLIKQSAISITPPPGGDTGYYLLPYHPFNYSAACKPCNSVLKKDYFPIAGNYMLNGDDPAQLRQEQPLLIYPLGDFDTPAEQLIGFHGVAPLALAQHGYPRARALVTIEFFKLDDVAKRKNLFRERAMVIVALFPQLCAEADGTGTAASRKIIQGCTALQSGHSNCARSFQTLFQRDRAAAQAIFEAAADFVASIS